MDNNTQDKDIQKVEENHIEGNIVDQKTTEQTLAEELHKGKYGKYVRFTLAALSSIPWIGSFMGAVAGLGAEFSQDKTNDLLKLWLQEHEGKIKGLWTTLQEIFTRLDNFGDEVQKRIESPEYLALVRSAFRSWDNADTEEKRQMAKMLIMNAGASTLCTDDLVRLFIKWIDDYHESHFLVIKHIYQHPRITRGQIWDNNNETRPREDSAEADLFRYLIRDLSVGGVIRQQKEVDGYGRFMKTQHHVNRGLGSTTMESAFEDTKPYVLTALGEQFVHYVLNEVAPQISD